MPPTPGKAAQHQDWKRRVPMPTMKSQKVTLEALDRMADDLDGARRALTDLALGVTVVRVQTSPGRYDPPTRQQAADLASDATLLPALLQEDLARIYALPPDMAALKLFMGYVMGATPTSTEAVLRQELERSHQNQALLAEVLRDYVSPHDLPEVAAQLRRIAEGH